MYGVKMRQKGFALPSVVITSLVMFTILVSMVGSVASVRVTLDGQYYQALSRDASESGITVARECLRLSNGVPGWNSTTPLTASTDCNGVTRAACPSGCFIVSATGVRSDFRIGSPTVGTVGSAEYTSDGKTELLRKTGGAIWKTYNYAYAASEKLQAAPQIAGGSGWKENGHMGAYISYTGRIFAFGDNSSGQLGPSLPYTAITKPMEITLPSGVNRASKVYTSGQGANILCMISSDSDAYCQGKPGAGEEGLIPFVDGWHRFNLPLGLKAKNITMHGLGADAACVTTTTSQAYCAGLNWEWTGENRALGTASTASIIPINAPERFLLPAGLTVKSMYLHDDSTCAIASDNNAYCAGTNGFGQLGIGNYNELSAPVLYPLPGGRKAKDIASGYHSGNSTLLVLATDGTAWGSGANGNGELGVGTEDIHQLTPVQFGSRNDYVALLSGPEHFCGVTSGGEVWCSGENSTGGLGNGLCQDSLVPVRFNLPAGELASTDITPLNNKHFFTTSILTQSGKIFTAGTDQYGKSGSGTFAASRCNPVQMSMPAGVTATSLTTLDEYSNYFIASNGFLYSVGRNNVGQLGDGTLIDRYTPVPTVYMRSLTIY